MDGEAAAPETEVALCTEVARVEEEVAADDAGESDQKTPNSKKKGGKRAYQKVSNIADFYAPAPYTSATKGGGGKGKGEGKGKKGDGEEGGKGKGKRPYYTEGEAVAKPEEDAAKSQPSVVPGPVAEGGDPSQAKGGASAKKKQQGGGKSREGGGKDKGGGKGVEGGKAGGGKGGAQAPRKGASAGGKGPRGMMSPNEMAEAGPDAEGPRAPGPQRPPVATAKGAAPMVGMPVVSGAYPFGMPYPYAGHMASPYGGAAMPAMYAMPQAYYFMPQGIAQQPFAGMPGAAPVVQAAAPPPLTPADRTALKDQVQVQIDYYFGMENLLKDVFLRKHMTDDGWVPIALLAGFRRIQNMTCDVTILMEAIQTSTLVELNPQNTHIRLRNEWPRWILAPQQAGATADAPPPQTAIRSTP